MGELNDTALLEKRSKDAGNAKKRKGGPGRGNVTGLDFLGVVDVLTEMQWRLDHPSAPAETPPQKEVLLFFKRDFQGFVTQYTELRAAKANEELAKVQAQQKVHVVSSGEEALEISETDLKIDEAIDRVIAQLEEFEHDEGRIGEPMPGTGESG